MFAVCVGNGVTVMRTEPAARKKQPFKPPLHGVHSACDSLPHNARPPRGDNLPDVSEKRQFEIASAVPQISTKIFWQKPFILWKNDFLLYLSPYKFRRTFLCVCV
jgi:hypothetical protein